MVPGLIPDASISFVVPTPNPDGKVIVIVFMIPVVAVVNPIT